MTSSPRLLLTPLLLTAACGSPAPPDAAADLVAAPPGDLGRPGPDLAVAADLAALPDLAAPPDRGAGDLARGGDLAALCKPATAPGAAVLVPCATRVELVDDGNGFRPPPPMGSNCRGEASYRLALGPRTLAWSVCRIPGNPGAPWLLDNGTRTLTAAELTAAQPALAAVTIVAGMRPCGADKPLRTITVATPAGDQSYFDSFYVCQMKGIYVDQIDGAFAALGALAK